MGAISTYLDVATCTKCQRELPRCDFSASQPRRCKACVNAYSKSWELNNPDRVKAKNKRSNDKRRCEKIAYNRAYYARNAEWLRTSAAAYRARFPERTRSALRSSLLRRYGLTDADYDRMFEEQGGHCKLCPRPTGSPSVKALVVDHCHRTGRVRGLLCVNCNTLLGMAGDSIPVLSAAIAYIEKSNECNAA